MSKYRRSYNCLFKIVKNSDDGRRRCDDWDGFVEVAFKKVLEWFYVYFMVGHIFVVEGDKADER